MASHEAVARALRELGVDLNRETFDLTDVVEGAAVEREHTPETLIATKIAVDHLRECSTYYRRLRDLERSCIRRPLRFRAFER